jgi:hypothetical protein
MGAIRRSALGLLGVALLANVALAASLWSWGLPLTNDGPVHVFAAYVANHYDDEALRYQEIYQLNSPITSRGFFEMQRLLEPLLGWRTAWRVNNILIASLYAWGYFAFVAALAPRRRFVGLLGFALALQPMLYLGFLPFLLSSGVCWLALAFWLRRPGSVVDHMLLAALLFLAARVHVAPVISAGAVFFALTIARSARLGQGVLAIAAAGLPAMVVAVLATGAATPQPLDKLVWDDLFTRLWEVGRWACAGSPWRVTMLLGLVVAGLASAVSRARQCAGGRQETALVATGLILLLVTLSLPRDLVGWQFAGARLAPLGVGLVLALLAIDHARPLVRFAAVVGVTVFLVASLLWSVQFHAQQRVANAPVLRGLDITTPARDWFVILTAASLRDVMGGDPLFHVHHLMAVEHGGGAIYSHDASKQLHHILRRKSAQMGVADPAFVNIRNAQGEQRALVLARFLAFASLHDGLWLIGTAADIEQAKALGFVSEFESGATTEPTAQSLIARFEGCEGRVRLEGATMPLTIEVGWWPAKSSSETFAYQPGGPVEAPLPPLACGEVWIKAEGAGGAHCDGQTTLPVRTTFQRGANNVLHCRVLTNDDR